LQNATYFVHLMRKTKLVVDFELNTNVIGLVTTLKDYKLAWNLNQVFKINLVKQPRLVIEFIKGENLSVVNFIYQTEVQQTRLIKNRGLEDSAGYLIPELTKFDYFLMINGGDSVIPESLVEGLHSIKEIEYFQKIDVAQLKSKDNFIF